MGLDVGDKAPGFTMPTDGGGTVSSASLAGGKVVLYFYPKDDTSGCTKEACGFRDNFDALAQRGFEVIGVSKDPVRRHDRFKAKHDLPFTLACDEDGSVCEAFGVWIEKKLYGRAYMGIDRATFLIDEDGVVQAVWRKVRVPGHVEAVIEVAGSMA